MICSTDPSKFKSSKLLETVVILLKQFQAIAQPMIIYMMRLCLNKREEAKT